MIENKIMIIFNLIQYLKISIKDYIVIFYIQLKFNNNYKDKLMI